MKAERPSRTALAVAIGRAEHQTLDRPIFVDPYAARILGARVRAGLAAKGGRRSAFARYLRAAVASRSRLAEDALAAAVARGVRQYVVLGAGLDTFALRNPYPEVRVFEVDHPNTQAWKRSLLRGEGLAPDVTFVPVDFERQELATQLAAAGLDPSQPTFFSWLGVVHYLEPEAREATLRAVASLSGATGGIVFDFFRKLGTREWLLRFIVWLRMRRVARLGEPFRAFLDPAEVRAQLERLGFANVAVLGPEEVSARLFRYSNLRVSPITYVAVATRG